VEPERPSADDGWLDDPRLDSDMTSLIRDFDWSATPLGPPSSWSSSLRNAVRLCLSTRFPALIVWGPTLVKIYNDGYCEILGTHKHPEALGAPAEQVWAEIWDEIGPMFADVLETGRPTWSEHQRLVLERNGFAEECFFTFSYSALFDDDGSVAGALDVVTETTSQVVIQRRLACLTDLSAALLEASTVADVFSRSVEVLARHPDDVVAADFHRRDGDEFPMVASTRGGASHLVADLLPLDRQRAKAPLVLGQSEPGAPAEHVVVPVRTGIAGVSGVMILALNPHRPYDRGYVRFVRLVRDTIASALENAHRRSAELVRQRTIADTLQHAMLSPVPDTEILAVRHLSAVDHLDVGGDWYDVIDLDGGRRAVVVGDCVGHGLAAATAMAQLRSAARVLLLDGHGPAAVLETLDVFAGTVDGASLATAVCVVIDDARREVTWCRAGHPPPLLASTSAVRWLDGHVGPPLAVMPDLRRHDSRAELDPDHVLIIYTDGLVERRGEVIDTGLERLASTVRALGDERAPDIADATLSALVPAGIRDDVVIVVIRAAPPGRDRSRTESRSEMPGQIPDPPALSPR
jgi:hypothetical protein